MQWWRAGELVLLVAASVGGFSMVEEGQHQQVGRLVGSLGISDNCKMTVTDVTTL